MATKSGRVTHTPAFSGVRPLDRKWALLSATTDPMLGGCTDRLAGESFSRDRCVLGGGRRGAIARALKDTLPIGSIIVLKGSHRSQDIGQCCWTGCEFLKSKSMGHAWFSARSAKPAAGGTDSLSSRCGRPPRWHCTCRESPCDQENTRCWKMTVARGSEMKAQIEPLVETDCR
jgi:hypothetical protein